MPAKKRQFTVILEPEPDGGYSVHCPALPGCVSQGDDRKSALANIQEAIILVWEAFKNDSNAPPEGTNEALSDIPLPPRESPEVLLNEIKEIFKAQREDELPPRIETVQVEVNSPASA